MTKAELEEILKNPVNRSLISRAVSYEDRLKLHCQVTLDEKSTKGLDYHFKYVEGRIKNVNKFEIYKSVFPYPVKTVSLTEKVFESYKKVNEGKNAIEEIHFASDDNKQDYSIYLDETKFNEVWQERSLKSMRESINDLMIVDFPSEQTTDKPEPYWYLKPLRHCKDIALHSDGKVKWLLFRESKDYLVVISDMVYQRWKTQPNLDRLIGLESEVFHNFSFCPVDWFWSQNLESNDIVKKSPVTPYLSDFDEYLFRLVSYQHLGDIALYPYMVKLATECDYSDNEGNYCENGYLKNKSGDWLYLGHSKRICPDCSNRNMAGVGTTIELPYPDGLEGEKEIQNPIRLIGADVPTLQLNRDELNTQKSAIYSALTGYESEAQNKQALNRDQVNIITENARQVLLNIKKPLDKAKQWLLSTMAIGRYGEDFKGCTVDSGTEFYLLDAETILANYDLAAKTGFNDIALEDFQNDFFETKYRFDQKGKERQKIIQALDPFNHLSKVEVTEMYRANETTYDLYMIKKNLISFVKRFEQENINVVDFGIALDFKTKIKRIQDTLKMYATEMKPIAVASNNSDKLEDEQAKSD